MATFNLEELETQIILPCRLCANNSDKIIGIYSSEGISNDLPNKMNQHLPIQVSETDTLPLQCCLNCASTLLAWHEFSISCAEAERKLQEIQTIELKVLDEETEYQEEHIETEDIELDADIDVRDDGGSSQEELKPVFVYEADIKQLKSEEYGEDIKPEEDAEGSPETDLIVLNETCELCDEKFKTKSGLKLHISRKHGELRRSQRAPKRKNPGDYEERSEKKKKNAELLEKCLILDADNKKRYKCPECEYIFKYPSTFISHQTVHTGEKSFCCHICGKNFRILSGLKHHINEFHLKIKNYPCDVCGVKFTAKAFRDEHLNIHTNNRPYVCDICGKAFKQSGSLYVHKMFHTNNFRFPCEICGKKFRRATELKIHNRLHTGEKPYKCELCDAAFIESKGLKTHVKIHDKSKVYVCSICGNKFSQERYLKNHVRNHRKKSNTVAPTEKTVKVEEAFTAGI